ncbi:MAG: hypothetical protein U0892_16745 [Pirellulales bacterium]
MNARKKLNTAHVNGAIIFAVLAAWFNDSWIVFVIALAVIIGLAIYSGDIRAARVGMQQRRAAR